HRRVDLGGAQPGRQDVAGDAGQREHLARVVALVGDTHEMPARAEGEQQLGGVRDQADDAHWVTLRSPSPDRGSLDAMATLSEQEVRERLGGLDGWELPGGDGPASLQRNFEFPDFAAALAFVNRVGELAEGANHHPDILLHGWNKVRLTLSTHSQGGLTGADFDLAERVDGLS